MGNTFLIPTLPLVSSQVHRQLLRWNHHKRRPSPGSPHQHLCIVGVGPTQRVGWDGLRIVEDVRLLLVWPAHQRGPWAKGHAGIYGDVHAHSPADGLQHYALFGDSVERHQPGDEALVARDVRQHWRVAVADGHRPGHTGVEVVIHTDSQARGFVRGAHQRDCLRGVAVPGVADAIWVADGLDTALTQLRQLPAGPERPTEEREGERERERRRAELRRGRDQLIAFCWGRKRWGRGGYDFILHIYIIYFNRWRDWEIEKEWMTSMDVFKTK